MKKSLFAAALALLAASGSCLAQDAPKAKIHSAPTAGLIVASDAEGGHVEAGSVAVFRVHNASPRQALGSLSAKIEGGKGFRVVSNGCAQGLAPRETCKVSVAFREGARASSADLVMSSPDDFEVRAALHGDPSPIRQ